jgi:Ca2+:H+ antiporter
MTYATLKREWPLCLNIVTVGIFWMGSHSLLHDLQHPVRFTLVLSWLVLVVALSAFAVVRHAEFLAHRLGEPYGTLILTLAVTAIEVMIIVATMSAGDGSPTLARDAMFAVLMIVLNGLVGISLLIGGIRHHEQEYNLQGASAFLAVILPLAVVGLVLPSFTQASSNPTFSPLQAAVWAVVSVALYLVFLAIQNIWHRSYFQSSPVDSRLPATLRPLNARVPGISYHAVLLFTYMAIVATLAKQLAVPIDFTIRVAGAPVALAGLLVAVIVLAPEAMTAIRAALANDLQRSVNVLLGSALATIGLTIPAVLTYGLLENRGILLGLDPVGITLLALTMLQSILTFSSSRTNVLFGAVHLLLFAVYLLLWFR